MNKINTPLIKTKYDILFSSIQEFLLALSPPVFLDKEKLTRWHPDFELEKVPDIKAQDIPLPKTQVVNTSAKQLLGKLLGQYLVSVEKW